MKNSHAIVFFILSQKGKTQLNLFKPFYTHSRYYYKHCEVWNIYVLKKREWYSKTMQKYNIEAFIIIIKYKSVNREILARG